MKTQDRSQTGTIDVCWQENTSPFAARTLKIVKKPYKASELIEMVPTGNLSRKHENEPGMAVNTNLKAKSISDDRICATCEGRGYWTDSRGTVRTCLDCL